MSSDKGIGAGILIACIVVAVLYFGSFFIEYWSFLTAVKIVVSAGFVMVLGIGGWIGWTMASTPSPEPIEDMDLDFEEEEIPEPEEEEETSAEEVAEDIKEELADITGMAGARIQSLIEAGYDDIKSIADATEEELTEVKE